MNEGTAKRSSIDWSDFCRTVNNAQNFIIMGHVRPDGDTIGSLVAMKRALAALGKETLLLNGHAVPPALAFVDPNNEVRKIAEMTEEERAFAANADVVMAVDVSSWAQLGPEAGEFFKPGTPGVKVVIDHHAVGDSIGDVRCVDSNSDSAGSLVFEAIQALGAPFSKEIAEPLFVAISSDTGWFRFQSTTSGTLRRAAELVDAGVQVDEMYRLQNEQESFARYKLLGAVASKAERFLDGKGVFMRLTQQDFKDAGAIPADSEDLVNTPLVVAGMEVAVIVIEQPDGTVKASFRSRCDLDCGKLAREFGGGGHARAAGASHPGDFETAVKDFKSKTIEYYNALN
ncbi:MAG: DHH family phosphoesterase [Thermoguttaceae bacterium]|jgi:phosphoesterase RecJ-like protein|nr:DHH family phosphoesterase [Thermoguttaceae bacterium]